MRRSIWEQNPPIARRMLAERPLSDFFAAKGRRASNWREVSVTPRVHPGIDAVVAPPRIAPRSSGSDCTDQDDMICEGWG